MRTGNTNYKNKKFVQKEGNWGDETCIGNYTEKVQDLYKKKCLKVKISKWFSVSNYS